MIHTKTVNIGFMCFLNLTEIKDDPIPDHQKVISEMKKLRHVQEQIDATI